MAPGRTMSRTCACRARRRAGWCRGGPASAVGGCSCTEDSGGQPSTGRTPDRSRRRSRPPGSRCASRSSAGPASAAVAGPGRSMTWPLPWTRCRRWSGRPPGLARSAMGRCSWPGIRPAGTWRCGPRPGTGFRPDSSWHAPGGQVRGVVALAAVSDMPACHALRLGQGAARALLGGGPGRHPDRYRLADPMQLLPVGCPVRLVHGSADDRVPCGMSRDYLARARAAGDDAVLDELPGAGHFDVIDPLSPWWPRVLGRVHRPRRALTPAWRLMACGLLRRGRSPCAASGSVPCGRRTSPAPRPRPGARVRGR